jgi:hypothetical protein
VIVEQGQQITSAASPFEASTTVSSASSAGKSYLLKQETDWTWEDLRDYIITSAEHRFGPQLRDALKEASILKAFIGRHGIENAVLVAMAAYEVYDGMWMNAPVAVTRFTKNSDPYFADVILARVSS